MRPVFFFEKALYCNGVTPSRKLVLPDFLVIGVQKSATHWLFENLRKHPDIFMPERKELDYFSNNARFFSYPLSYYASYFSSSPEKIKGEATPCCNLPVSRIRFIRRIMPNVRLIIILRNPVDRLWSAALMYLVRAEKRKFDDITESDFHQFFSRPDVISRGFYPQILRNWRSVFPEEQFLICFYDDLLENTKHFLERIFRFLGVQSPESWSDFPYESRINKSLNYVMPPALRNYYLKLYEPHILELSKEFAEKPLRWLKHSDNQPPGTSPHTVSQ
jgi:hypothetical protein